MGEALKGYIREKAFLSVKFGALVAPNGKMYGLDVKPQHIKNYLIYSLKRLGVDYIDLYQPARIDDLAIPVEETIGTIFDMVKAGYVKHIGMTQVDADTLRRRIPFIQLIWLNTNVLFSIEASRRIFCQQQGN